MNNQISKEVQTVLKKKESKKFVCFGNNWASDSNYNIPDYSKEDNRKKLVDFLKESSKKNEDLLQATTIITDEEFQKILEKRIVDISDSLAQQEIKQKNIF